MAKRDGGFDSSHFIFIDTIGNNPDPYQYVNLGIQYGLDSKKILQSIIVEDISQYTGHTI